LCAGRTDVVAEPKTLDDEEGSPGWNTHLPPVGRGSWVVRFDGFDEDLMRRCPDEVGATARLAGSGQLRAAGCPAMDWSATREAAARTIAEMDPIQHPSSPNSAGPEYGSKMSWWV